MNTIRVLALVGLSVGAVILSADAFGAGADIRYSGLGGGIGKYGPVGAAGSEVHAYVLGSDTCNVGNVGLAWTGLKTPGLAMNAYRLSNGRLEQIGVGMVKTACCAANFNGCGLSCSGGSGSVLGPGCQDTYDSSWNALQSRLAPRSIINPTTGTFGTIPTPTPTGTIARRLQVRQADLDPTLNPPGTLFFVEGQYICTEDATNGNWSNNASYSRVTVATPTYGMTATGVFYLDRPAIYAWQDHGSGAGVADADVVVTPVEMPNEGRFMVACKVKQTARNSWHYEYAVSNFNVDRAGRSFRVPLPAGAVVSNTGFHDVWYHDDDAIYSGTDWNVVNAGYELRWSATETYAQNPNANALRWGTMYNFWFDCDRAPVISRAEIGLFKPATACQPVALAFDVKVPGVACTNDVVRDGAVNVSDLLAVIGGWGPCICPSNCPANVNTVGSNTIVDGNDLLAIIGAWGGCP